MLRYIKITVSQNVETLLQNMYFVKWIAYQDPNPHGMQQIGLSTK